MMKRLLLLVTMMLALPGLEAASSAVPKPKLRPAAPLADSQPAPVAPVPRPRPTPGTGEPVAPPVAAGWSAAGVADARRACDALLSGLDIDIEPLEPIGQPGGCGTPAPVSVTRVAGVALTPPATLTCDMAAALHGWVAGTLKPAARQRLKTEVTAINTASSYVCRRRNNSSGGKLSEHGRANALDISGFSFAGREGAAVGGGTWGEGILASLGVSRDGSFLEAVRRGACGHFTTVLGPGSDPFHGDHFHVDVLRRRNDYRICK